MPSNSPTTWEASSRVGTRTSACGRPDAPGANRSTMGMAKASVLPEPVRDSARTSCPASASPMTRAWIGKGVEMPRPARDVATDADTPRSGKDWVGMLVFLSAALEGPRRSGEVSLPDAPNRPKGGTAEANPHGARSSPVALEYQPRSLAGPADLSRVP